MAEPNEIMPDIENHDLENIINAEDYDEQILAEEEEEEFDDSIPLLIPDQNIDNFFNIIQSFRSYFNYVDVNLRENIMEISIPTSIFPLTIRASNILLNSIPHIKIYLNFDNFDWNDRPTTLKIENTLCGEYNGQSHIYRAADKFFEPNFTLKSYYRSLPLISGFFNNDEYNETVRKIIRYGFSISQASQANFFCGENYEECIAFLETGQLIIDEEKKILLERILSRKNDCPLLLFVLEILDAILDVQDHCCVCGKPILPGLKERTCDSVVCKNVFYDLHMNFIIKRDPLFVDLLLSAFSCFNYNNTDFFEGSDLNRIYEPINRIIDLMPPMSRLSNFSNDSDLRDFIGNYAFKLLNKIFLSSSFSFIHLQHQFEIQVLHSRHQFMVLGTPNEQQIIFMQLKKRFGSKFFFYPLRSDLFYKFCIKGFENNNESGIYLTSESHANFQMNDQNRNKYRNSSLGSYLHSFVLCEVINLPLNQKINVDVYAGCNEDGNPKRKNLSGSLRQIGINSFLLSMFEAIIPKFVLVDLSEQINLNNIHGLNLPTLEEIVNDLNHLNN